VILLDTHVVLWLTVKPERLSKAAARAIKRAERSDGVAIASITLWEIAQLIDDETGATLAASSTLKLEGVEPAEGQGRKVALAKAVGAMFWAIRSKRFVGWSIPSLARARTSQKACW